MASSMNWEDREGTRWILMEGDLDYAGSEDLEGRFMSVLAEGTGSVIVDLSKVSFMGSQGIRLLLHARRTLSEKDRELRVTGLSPGLKHLFTTTGLDHVISELDAQSGEG